MAKGKFFTKKKVIVAIVVLAAGALIVPSLLQGGKKTPPLVSVKEASTGDIRSVLSTTGTISARESDTYIAPMSGIKVAQVNVKEGDFVKAGTLLVAFDSTEVERQYRQASLKYDISYYNYLDTIDSYEDVQDDLNETKMDIKKLYSDIEDYDDEIASVQASINSNSGELKALYIQLESESDPDKKAVIESKIAVLTQTIERLSETLGQLTASLNAKENRLEQKKSTRETYQKQLITDNKQKQLDAQLKLDEIALDIARQNYKAATAGIVAQTDGVVTSLSATENTYVTEGQQLVVISSKDPAVVSVALSRYDLERVALGQQATIKFLNREYQAVVDKISDFAVASASGTPSVHAELLLQNPDEHIKIGLEANVEIITAEKSGMLTIPVETVSTDREGRYVYLAKDGIVVKQYITTGVSSDLLVEVLSGLNQGDLVLYNPPEYITPGMEVTTTFEDLSTLGGSYIMMGV